MLPIGYDSAVKKARYYQTTANIPTQALGNIIIIIYGGNGGKVCYL